MGLGVRGREGEGRGEEGEGELSTYSSKLSPRAHKKATAGMGPDLSNTLTPKAKAGAAGLERGVQGIRLRRRTPRSLGSASVHFFSCSHAPRLPDGHQNTQLCSAGLWFPGSLQTDLNAREFPETRAGSSACPPQFLFCSQEPLLLLHGDGKPAETRTKSQTRNNHPGRAGRDVCTSPDHRAVTHR